MAVDKRAELFELAEQGRVRIKTDEVTIKEVEHVRSLLPRDEGDPPFAGGPILGKLLQKLLDGVQEPLGILGPPVTVAHIQGLLEAAQEEPVLYVKHGPDNDGSGDYELDVWAGAKVSPDSIVLRRHEVADELGEGPDRDSIVDQLEEYQEKVDGVVATFEKNRRLAKPNTP